MFKTLFLVTLPTLIVVLSAQSAVTMVRHPSAKSLAARAELREMKGIDDAKDDVGSRGKLVKVLLIGLAISVGMSCFLGLMVWVMHVQWLIRFTEWIASVVSPKFIIISVVVCMEVGSTKALVGCFSWLTKRRLVLVIIAQLLVVALWVKFDWWLTLDALAAMATVTLILHSQYRASFLRLSLILLVAAFLYDAWQVYGTGNMMEYVRAIAPVRETASQERGYGLPTLFVVPESFALHAKWVGILGVGDVLVGGIMAVTALRVGRRVGTRAPFYAVVAAYATSLLCVDIVMRQFHAAQPATIYIVPICMGAMMLWALASGNWAELKKPAFGEELYASE